MSREDIKMARIRCDRRDKYYDVTICDNDISVSICDIEYLGRIGLDTIHTNSDIPLPNDVEEMFKRTIPIQSSIQYDSILGYILCIDGPSDVTLFIQLHNLKELLLINRIKKLNDRLRR